MCLPIGEEVVVNHITFKNDVGGTDTLDGSFRVRVLRQTNSRGDYEARLVNAHDVIAVSKAGTTGYTVEHYATTFPNRPELAEEVRAAKAAFDPARVFVFDQHRIG